jgi:hypothetical protein
MVNSRQGKSVQHQDLRQDLLVDPMPSDVMLGRGRAFLHHPGNRRLNAVVKMNMQRYLKATNRNEKTWITEEIVQIIQKCGSPPGRFLRYKPKAGGWYEVDDEEARVKVSHTVRYRRRCFERHEVSESTDSEGNEVSESTDSSLSLNGEEPDSSVEEPMSPVYSSHQVQPVKPVVTPSNSPSSPLIPFLFDAVMLAELDFDAAIFTDLGPDISCVTHEQDSYDFDQHGNFIF